ncbi:MAG TPA: hypothetical protein VK533_11805 [Sphingomonas sp.]|uniref:hypothetical protein n=1 Tax=Sphingomonas sp. TaxID=28214 RepID=UPI002CB804FD|nr:hypothetical protein [Sphingomonas sp.]HMI20222.1 hypothetical protein [Sphingomonas sp.]
MSHEPPAGWVERRVRAAMQNETDALRTAIATLADMVRVDREAVQAERDAAQADREAVRADRDADRAAIAEARGQAAELRGMIELLSAELRARSEQTEAGLIALREAMDRDERIEKLRLHLEGFSAQHRWDVDQLRQSLAAVAERLPLGD